MSRRARQRRWAFAFLVASAVSLLLFTATLPAASTPDAASPATGSEPTDATSATAVDAASSPVATAPPTTDAAAPRRFTLVASGDLLPHQPVYDQAAAYGDGTWDFSPMFERVRDRISGADLAICHLETMLSRDNSRLSSYPQFLVPNQLADAIAGAGYDACSVASNHSLDHGVEAMASTLDHLDRVGVRHAGGARSAEEAATPDLYEVISDDGRPVTVGHLSYSYGFNGFRLPADAPWAANQIDPEAILAAAAATRAAGAEVVVLSLHWGIEYQHDPTAEQVSLAEALLASPDVDVILGHHAHVVQPIERIGTEVVVYGMGNFLSNQHERAATRDGVLVELTFTERPAAAGGGWDTAVAATPTIVERPGFRITPTGPDVEAESHQRTLGVLTQRDPEILGPAA